MEDAHHLFGNGACPAHIPSRCKILQQGVSPGRPVDPAVAVKPAVFRGEKGLLQQNGNLIQGQPVMDIPGIVVGDGEGDAVPVEKLLPAKFEGLGTKGGRQWPKIRAGSGAEPPAGRKERKAEEERGWQHDPLASTGSPSFHPASGRYSAASIFSVAGMPMP